MAHSKFAPQGQSRAAGSPPKEKKFRFFFLVEDIFLVTE
jgi:hypothetical protein